ncbi:type II toxin-antitoxin system RelE/ParE family toxin [Microcystis aeruginosa]|uniref:type II toxin-antitoxin system RelE/ParE family toxin n=1 Tax=Microcystis aeruginosa TaxID=1126 RepID=UPI0012305BCF|nr:type II toxin-antitoxin system RelE/ParE family toxin [Microcystis aeruginosa]
MVDKQLKTVIWIGASKKELLEFPEEVIDEVGYILYRVQHNQNHPNIKALKGFNGVFEIVSDYQTDTYRTVYAIKLSNAIFILHAFQKKSKSGIKTPKQNVNLIKERLKKAQEIAKEQ